MGWNLGTIKGRYTAVFLGFMALVCALTVIGIQLWIKPALQKAGEQNVAMRVSEIATDIRDQLNGVQSQSRSITQLVAQLPSEQIDALLPALIDQYGNAMVFGGGIWPLPEKREAGRATEVLAAQVRAALEPVAGSEATILLAYEPVWAIGAGGIPATADYADARHAEIASVARQVMGRHIPCLYGGSVNPGNCAELIACPHVDGLFIGRSAWDVAGYLDILARCAATMGETA